MKSNFKVLMYLVFITSFLFTSCDEKDDFQDTEDPVIINSTGINTGLEANNNETSRLVKILSSETITTNLNISVFDENNTTISNATIEIENETFVTDENGYVLLEDIKINKTFQVIKTNSVGYTTSIKTITPSENGVTNVFITLLQPTFEQTFNSNEGGTVSNDKLSIEFPTNAIADQNGDLFDGDVTATVTYYDPNSDSFSATIPGTLVGLDDDDTMQALLSKGMIKVDLTDNSGKELEIFEGEEATITLPAANDDPETIDFWHLNEAKGIWVQTGTATKVGNTYITTVTHFSTYNLDLKTDPINIDFTIKDNEGNLIANQPATIIATTNSGTYSKLISTDNLGQFTIINAPKGADYSLHFLSECDDFTLSAGTINETSSIELVINQLFNSRITTLEGTLYQCNNEPYSNKVFTINIVNMNNTDRITAYTDAEGKYSVTSLLCNYDTSSIYKAEIRVFDGLNDIVNETALLLDSNKVTKNIVTCNGTIETVSERIFNGEYVIDSEDSYLAFIEAGFTEVTGYLTISNITASDLTAFNTLTSVGGLKIQENEFLTNLEGLENITHINFGISIYKNPNLVSLVNFSESIEYITNLDVTENNKLTSLDGLENIEIGGLYTQTNGEIYFHASLSIKKNLSLTNIDALKNNINADSTIFTFVFIENNKVLETLSGLEGVAQASWISIRNNPLITNLDVLSDMTNVDLLEIASNGNLTDITGLSNLIEIENFRIVSNDNLNDFCSLNTNMISLIIDDGNNDFKSKFQISGNSYNPTKEDLLNGDCSQ